MPPLPNPDYREIARRAAAQYGINPDIFIAQINQESGFNPDAKSPAGAIGIAQFMPGTAAGLGVNPYNPSESLYGAAKLMAGYLHTYQGSWVKALIAYNAGPGPVGGGDNRNRPDLVNYPSVTWPSWFSQPIAYVKSILGIDIRDNPAQINPPSRENDPGDVSNVPSFPPKTTGPDVPSIPAPGTTTPSGKDTTGDNQNVTDVYSGSIFKVDYTAQSFGALGSVDLPSGISLDPNAVKAASGFARYRMIPILMGLIITVLGGQLVAKGDTGARVLGTEVVIVGLSLIWFGYRNTINVAWGAIRP